MSKACTRIEVKERLSTIQTNRESETRRNTFLKQRDNTIIETKREKNVSQVIPLDPIKSISYINFKYDILASGIPSMIVG